MATVFSDDFNRADGSLGANWTVDEGAMTITSNEVVGGTGVNFARATGASPSSADYKVETERRSTSGNLNVFARSTDLNNLYLYQQQFNSILNLYKRVSGTWTQLGSNVTGSTRSIGDTVKIEVSGTTIKGFLNGVEQHSQTDSSITATGTGGVRNTGSNSFDNFIITDDVFSEYTQDLGETITTVDTMAIVMNRFILEVFSLNDQIYKNTHRLIADAIVILDNKFFSYVVALIENIIGVDTTKKTSTRILVETSTIVDNLSKTASKMFSEIVQNFDNISKNTNRRLRDTMSLVDSVSGFIVGVYTKLLTERVSITDTLTKIKDWFVKVATSWYTKDIED